MKQQIFTGLMSMFLLSVFVAPAVGQSSPRQQQHAQRRAGLFTQTSIENGWQQAVAQKRPLLVMFTTDGCQFCEKMLSQTYGNPAVERMVAQNAITVLAHAKNYPTLVKKLGIRGYPTSMLVSPKGEVLDFVKGYLEAKKFAQRVGPKLASARRVPTTAAIASQAAGR